MAIWNPWHGCHKISPGCQHCYVYRRDESIGKDASIVTKTGDYNLPLKCNRQKEYKLQPSDGTVFTCMTSDFFLEEADEWRPECWQMMRERSDLQFAIITKRIHRFMDCIPEDWGDGYPNVSIYCTVENQDDYYGAAEPPVRCGESHLSGLTEPPRLSYVVTGPALDPIRRLLS